MTQTQQQIQEILTNNPSINLPGFNWKYTQEGYNDYVFGAKNGPEKNISNILHEMAHAIDFTMRKQTNRLDFNNWGFKNISDFSTSLEPTKLECRVVAIQKHLHEIINEHGDSEQNLDSYASYFAKVLADFMCDWINGGDSKEERIQTRKDLIVENYNNYNKQDILNEWKQVCEYILIKQENTVAA